MVGGDSEGAPEGGERLKGALLAERLEGVLTEKYGHVVVLVGIAYIRAPRQGVIAPFCPAGKGKGLRKPRTLSTGAASV